MGQSAEQCRSRMWVSLPDNVGIGWVSLPGNVGIGWVSLPNNVDDFKDIQGEEDSSCQNFQKKILS